MKFDWLTGNMTRKVRRMRKVRIHYREDSVVCQDIDQHNRVKVESLRNSVVQRWNSEFSKSSFMLLCDGILIDEDSTEFVEISQETEIEVKNLCKNFLILRGKPQESLFRAMLKTICSLIWLTLKKVSLTIV